uniref:Uncharacterized protein n=1 Tax=Photinus pyralis TaxID=7054 RepID=A0A1Y1N2Q8_PHOPY
MFMYPTIKTAPDMWHSASTKQLLAKCQLGGTCCLLFADCQFQCSPHSRGVSVFCEASKCTNIRHIRFLIRIHIFVQIVSILEPENDFIVYHSELFKEMDWSNETVLEFVVYYEKEHFIWNASLSNHKNRNDVYDVWKRLKVTILMDNKYFIRHKYESGRANYELCIAVHCHNIRCSHNDSTR